MQHWANHAPMNFLHKFHLVEAEKHNVLDKNMEAMEFYDLAITGAKENKYIHEEALANELAGKFYLKLGRQKIAKAYLNDAYYSYFHWGAKAKVKDLQERYPKLLRNIFLHEVANVNTHDNNYVKQAISSTTYWVPNHNNYLLKCSCACSYLCAQTLSTHSAGSALANKIEYCIYPLINGYSSRT